ncbi:MAG: archease [Planctomycetota bacterium]
MGDEPGRWRTIEHTADLGIEVEAGSLERLFEAGAHGLAGVLLGSEHGSAGSAPNSATTWRRMVLEAPDREALLVDWLRELLYVQSSEGLLIAAAEIAELEDTKLVAQAGFSQPPVSAGVERELKGVTYHDLEISQRGDGWFARVVFDL